MRLQFEVPEDQVRKIDNLVNKLGLKTRVNLFNTALTLFMWAVRERESGRIIASVDEKAGQYKELEMPGFPPIIGGDEPEREEKDTWELLNLLAHYIDEPVQLLAWKSLVAASLSPEIMDQELQVNEEFVEKLEIIEAWENSPEIRANIEDKVRDRNIVLDKFLNKKIFPSTKANPA